MYENSKREEHGRLVKVQKEQQRKVKGRYGIGGSSKQTESEVWLIVLNTTSESEGVSEQEKEKNLAGELE